MLENQEWRDFVAKTEMSIIANPDQYLDSKPVSPQLMQLIVQVLFLEFFNFEELLQKNVKTSRYLLLGRVSILLF